ncbi:DUF6541 family protein [Amycolatopsis nigrescens]|uniref:DUF6541 family protein n=1 Tax=Amycolatopsis nigrescens TaxID=381445 RepID=UPI0003803FC1|nr:DUF6541 family protein [Amycolatopsis nigrescens]
MTTANLVYPLVGLLVLAVPGLLLQLAAGVRDKLWLAALTAPVSIGVFVVAGVVSAIPGVPYSPWLVLVLTVVLAAVLLLAWRRLRTSAVPIEPIEPAETESSFLPSLPPRLVLLAKIAAGLLCLGAMVLAFQPWRTGLGGWATYPQEHDTITHTWLTAYIERTGRGAPWDLLPLDLLTGGPVSFYPSGLPLTAALSGDLAGGAVVGFNVINALVIGPVFVLGCAALAAAIFRRLKVGPEWTALAGGIAALVAAGLYRPGVNLLHDGGIAPNAVAMSLAPGLIAALITIGRRQWLRAVLLGLGLAGVFAVHPSSVATIGASVVVFWVVEACTARGREILRGQWPVLLVAGVVTVLAALGQVLGSLSQATRTGSWQPDIGPAPIGDAVGTNLMLTYGGYFDSKQMYAQVAAATMALLGVAAILLTRRAWGALGMWAFWLLISVDFKLSPASGIGSTLIGSFFYKSYVRIQAHVSLFVPVLAAFGVLVTAVAVAKLVGSWRKLPAAVRAPGPVTAAVLAVVVLVYTGWAAIPYEHRNAEIVASRYVKPEFVRVNDDDRKAADWLAANIQPGQRVMNSANDGSTFAYIDDAVPLVNVVTLGNIQIPYTFELLKSFHDYPKNPQIRQAILDLNIAYVYVDSQAPVMGAGPGAPANWLGEPTYTVAPGLKYLDGLPGISVGFKSGTVTVYRLDRRALADLRP